MFYALASFQKMNLILEASGTYGALYLGDIDAANDVKNLEKYGITAVLTVAAGARISYDKQVVDHLVIAADDIETYNLARHFDRGMEFIERNRSQGRSVLVHCFAGVSRSATMTLAYLMKYYKMTFIKAMNFVKSKRRVICPNAGFRLQLREFERKLKIVQQPPASGPTQLVPPGPLAGPLIASTGSSLMNSTAEKATPATSSIKEPRGASLFYSVKPTASSYAPSLGGYSATGKGYTAEKSNYMNYAKPTSLRKKLY